MISTLKSLRNEKLSYNLSNSLNLRSLFFLNSSHLTRFYAWCSRSDWLVSLIRLLKFLIELQCEYRYNSILADWSMILQSSFLIFYLTSRSSKIRDSSRDTYDLILYSRDRVIDRSRSHRSIQSLFVKITLFSKSSN